MATARLDASAVQRLAARHGADGAIVVLLDRDGTTEGLAWWCDTEIQVRTIRRLGRLLEPPIESTVLRVFKAMEGVDGNG